MGKCLECDFSKTFVSYNQYKKYDLGIRSIHRYLHDENNKHVGWVEYPCLITENLIKEIKKQAAVIQDKCTALVVVGVGGSYLGARAGIEMLQSPFYNEYFAKQRRLPRIYYVGHNLSSVYYSELMEVLQNEEVCLCVISKSGTTMEPALAFQIFKNFLRKKYGEEAKSRIYVITDENKGSLREEAGREGYVNFSIPRDIGGRYSVLTPVGLLPIAVAGIDIEEVIEGAKVAYHQYSEVDLRKNKCYQYALQRYLLGRKGKTIEIFEVYEPRLMYFTEWLKQLFGESEGKEGKGIFPASLQMSTDLHSMGQFLQDGNPTFFETVITVDKVKNEFILPENDATDHVRTMHQLNKIVQQSALEAHLENKTPNIVIQLPDISAHTFGQLVYFFEKACAVSCYLQGVDPFNQPGVELYKANIKERIVDETIVDKKFIIKNKG